MVSATKKKKKKANNKEAQKNLVVERTKSK